MVDLMGLVACHFAWKCKRYLRAGVGLWLVGFLVGVGRGKYERAKKGLPTSTNPTPPCKSPESYSRANGRGLVAVASRLCHAT